MSQSFLLQFYSLNFIELCVAEQSEMPLVDERGRKFSPGPLPSWQVRIVAGRRERVEQAGGGNTHCHTR